MNDINSGSSSSSTLPQIPLQSESSASKLATLKGLSPTGQPLVQEANSNAGSSTTALASAFGVNLGSPDSYADASSMQASLIGVRDDLVSHGSPSDPLSSTASASSTATASGTELSNLEGSGGTSGAISWGTLMEEMAQLAEQQNETEAAQFSAVDSGELSQMSTASSALTEGIDAAHEAYKAAIVQGSFEIAGGILGGVLGGTAGGVGGEAMAMGVTSAAKGIGGIASAGLTEQSQLDSAQAQFLNQLSGSENQETQSMISSQQNTQNVFSSLEGAILSLAQMELQSVGATRPTA